MENWPAQPEPLQIIACPHPFDLRRMRLEMEARVCLGEIVEAVQPRAVRRGNLRVWVNGELVPREDWGTFYPAPGAHIQVRAVPRGPVIGIFIAIAAVAAQIGVTAATGLAVWGILAGLVVSVLGFVIMSALVRPPTAREQLPSPGDTPTRYLSGARNQLSQYGVIPRVYGRLRVVPPLAANYFTEVTASATARKSSSSSFGGTGMAPATQSWPVQFSYEQQGDDQYLRMAVCWGFGPLQLESLRIAETALSEFDEVEIEHRYGYPGDEPLTLITQDIHEEPLNIQLKKSEGWQLRTSQTNVDELSVDVTFPSGLYLVDSESGGKLSITVTVEVAYSPTGAGDWTSLGQFDIRAAKMAAVRRGIRWTVANGTYDVRLRRLTNDSEATNRADDSYWTALRSITYDYPITETGVALTALRIKATDQLYGVVDELNGIVTSILRDWDKDTETWVEQATQNPASIFLDILTGAANSRPIADSRVDFESVQEWHEWCETKGFTCNFCFDGQTTVWDALQLVAATGRAAVAMINGKWGVAVDKEQEVPAQHFTPRNSWDFRAEQAFIDELHGFRVKFPNEEEDYQEGEFTVYADGYSEETATKFEELHLDGVTNYEQAYKLGRYFLAVAEHRRETVTFKADMEALVCLRGDWIKFAHDVMLIGLASARVREVLYEEGTGYYAGVIIDELVTMEAGLDYNLRARLQDGTSVLLALETEAGETDTLYLPTPLPLTVDFPQAGDLVTFGEADTETEDLIVKAIEPGPDLSATLTCVRYAPAVFTADEGEIPDYVPRLTIPAEWRLPNIYGIISDGSVLYWAQGAWQPRILVTLAFTPLMPGVTAIEGRFRRTGEQGTWLTVTASIQEREVSLMPVEDLVEYEMQFRFIREGGRAGNWTGIYYHTVEGKTAPPADVTGFVVYQIKEMLNFVWVPVADKDLAGYEIRYGAKGVAWDDAAILTQTHLSTTWTSAMVLPGLYDFLIKALDFSDNYSETAARKTFTVFNFYETLSDMHYEPGWPLGSYSNMRRNPLTGHLVPEDQDLAAGNNFNVFDTFVQNPYASYFYETPEIDLGEDKAARAWARLYAEGGPGESASGPTLQFDYRTEAGSYDGFEDWSIGPFMGRYVKFRMMNESANGDVVFTGFETMIDKSY